MATRDEPFSFTEVLAAEEGPPAPEPTMVAATDGTKLAVRSYRPATSASKAVLLFLHGGGAHSGAGYHALARKMSGEYGITVHTPDIRGHGKSEGDRGDAPAVDQVWKDVKTMLDYAQSQEGGASLPLFLGGHSSGGGLVVNYATWAEKEESESVPRIAGYLLLSPQLGYKSGTARPVSSAGRKEFATVNILAFILNACFGGCILSHNKAVRFNYPEKILEDPGMVSFNTVNMANAITPQSPEKQVQSMQSRLPLGLWVGEDDELFVAEKVAAFAKKDGKVIPEQNHLGIILNAHKWLGPWIMEHISSEESPPPRS